MMKMRKVKLTITKSACRCGYHRKGDSFLVEDLCPPLCHELWNVIYPYVFALQNGAELDHDDARAFCFDARCPDGGRVWIHGELEEQAEQIARISYYEALMQEAEGLLRSPDPTEEDLARLRTLAEKLEAYYAGDDWKRDFADDEAGLLPKVKRGVLSEDGLYNLLDEIRNL